MTSGIYMITCKSNGNRYIGSSNDIEKRIKGHWLNLKISKHHNTHMQNTWNKYGEENFFYSILEEVSDRTLLIEREQYWIDLLKPELNKAIKANSGFLGLRHTKKTREKLSEIQKERMKSEALREKSRLGAIMQNMNGKNPMKGKKLDNDKKQKLREMALRQFSSSEARSKHSEIMRRWCTPEIRKRISIAKTGTKRSDESKKKISASLLKKWANYSDEERMKRTEKTARAVSEKLAKHYKGFVDPGGNIYEDVYNLAEFCRKHKLSVQQMNSLNSGRINSHKGWRKL